MSRDARLRFAVLMGLAGLVLVGCPIASYDQFSVPYGHYYHPETGEKLPLFLAKAHSAMPGLPVLFDGDLSTEERVALLEEDSRVTAEVSGDDIRITLADPLGFYLSTDQYRSIIEDIVQKDSVVAVTILVRPDERSKLDWAYESGHGKLTAYGVLPRLYATFPPDAAEAEIDALLDEYALTVEAAETVEADGHDEVLYTLGLTADTDLDTIAAALALDEEPLTLRAYPAMVGRYAIVN